MRTKYDPIDSQRLLASLLISHNLWLITAINWPLYYHLTNCKRSLIVYLFILGFEIDATITPAVLLVALSLYTYLWMDIDAFHLYSLRIFSFIYKGNHNYYRQKYTQDNNKDKILNFRLGHIFRI